MSKPLILVVDDQPTHLKVCQLLLDKFGYGYCGAQDAEEALGLFKATDGFSVVLMDMRLDDMSGVECMRRMREIDSSRDRSTPIIAVTAEAMPGDRERCLGAGMDDYLAKPFSSDQLRDLLGRHVSGDQAARAPGLLASASAALSSGEHFTADLLFAQLIVLLERIFSPDRQAALEAAIALAKLIRGRGMSAAADELEHRARELFS